MLQSRRHFIFYTEAVFKVLMMYSAEVMCGSPPDLAQLIDVNRDVDPREVYEPLGPVGHY